MDDGVGLGLDPLQEMGQGAWQEDDDAGGRLRDFLDDDDLLSAVAALAMGGGLSVEESDWYNRSDKPQAFEAGCDVIGDFHIEHFTRFTRGEINTVATALEVPPRVFVKGAGYCDGKLALLFLLCRLAHPFRLKTLEAIFGYHHKRIGRWTNYLIQWLFDEWGHLLQLNLERFRREAPQHAQAFGVRLGYADPSRCRNILQVDGCFMEICHPKYAQELFYNAHYKGHGLKFQVCTGASGLLESVFGAMVGRKHDISLWRASGVCRDIDRLRATPIFPAGQGDAEADNRWFAVGDSAYKGDRDRVLIPHDRATPLTAAQQQFNKHLSRTRIAVEWGIGHVYTLWNSLRYRPANRVNVNPIGKHFFAAAIFTNCRTCMRGGNQISQYFNLSPPSLDVYLSAPKPAVHRLRKFMRSQEEELRRHGIKAD